MSTPARQNERFGEFVTFPGMVLCNNAPNPRAGGNRTFSLLYNMNELFETFISPFISRNVIPLLDSRATLTVQGRGDSRYLLRRKGGGRFLRIKQLAHQLKAVVAPFLLEPEVRLGKFASLQA